MEAEEEEDEVTVDESVEEEDACLASMSCTPAWEMAARSAASISTPCTRMRRQRRQKDAKTSLVFRCSPNLGHESHRWQFRMILKHSDTMSLC
jgi:hypothetical protein